MSFPQATISDLCDKIVVGHVGPSSGHRQEGGVPFLMGKNVGEGFLKLDALERVTPEFHEAQKKSQLSPGDVVVVRIGKSGLAAKVPAELGEANCSGLVVVKGPREVTADYLVHYLNSPGGRRESLKQAKGSTRQTLNTKSIAATSIPLPPLAEQKRIAGILDAADALRAKRRESLVQLDTFLQSTFLDMFGDPVTNPMEWEKTTLPEVSVKFTDGPFGSNLKSSHYVDKGVRVIRLQNIGIGEMLDDDLAFISEQHFASLPRNHCEPGDVLIGTLGDPNLRACVVPQSLKHSLNKADCMLMRVDREKANATYMCWLLNCPAIVRKAQSLVRGQTRGRISMGRLKELRVAVPPLDLQHRFAAVVESVEHQKASQSTHLDELDTLFASLQSRAFRGDL